MTACGPRLRPGLARLAGIAAVAGALAVPTPARAVAYRIETLGDLGGGYARARAINASGTIVGEALLASRVEHAFAHAGEMADLGTLGGERSRAFGVNDAGVACGWAQTADESVCPVLWTDAGVKELESPNGAGGTAWAINDLGVAVGNARTAAPGVYHATRWDADGAHDLGTLGGAYSIAYGINNVGIIVGSADNADGDEWACLWGAGGGDPQPLEALAGATWSAARAINDSGQMILWGDTIGSRGRAAFWDAGSVTDLGTFGGEQSWAYGLNGLGQAVGWAEFDTGFYHAFAWDETTGLADLGTLGGGFSSAYGINDAGIVVGYAQDDAWQWHAVRWVPTPEPGVLLLAAAASGWVWRRGREQRGLGR